MTNAEILDKIERLLCDVRVVHGIHDAIVDGLVGKTVLAARSQRAKEFDGRRDELAASLRRRYGFGEEEAERAVCSFEKEVRFPGAAK